MKGNKSPQTNMNYIMMFSTSTTKIKVQRQARVVTVWFTHKPMSIILKETEKNPFFSLGRHVDVVKSGAMCCSLNCSLSLG